MNKWNTACPRVRCVRQQWKEASVVPECGLFLIHIRNKLFSSFSIHQNHLGDPVKIPVPRPVPELWLQ